MGRYYLSPVGGLFSRTQGHDVKISLSAIDGENAPHWPFVSAPVSYVRDLRHGSRAYFEIKASRRNSA